MAKGVGVDDFGIDSVFQGHWQDDLVEVVEKDPFAYPPAFEPLVGSLSGMYSRRINRQHRFVYEVFKDPIVGDGSDYDGTVKVLSMWTQYETV